MTRGISWGGTPLPVTDASISAGRDPIREQSMSGLGGEVLYGGVYNSVQGSFSGALRSSIASIISRMLSTPQTPVSVVVAGDGGSLTGTSCVLTGAEISVKAGELARFSCNFTGMTLSAGGSVGSADFSAAVPVFYNSSTSFGTCAGFSIKIDRPYTADDFVLGSYYSESIYQSGETTVEGTITFSQTADMSVTDLASLTFTLGDISISIAGAVMSAADISVSGRGLVGKTFTWSCPSTGISIS